MIKHRSGTQWLDNRVTLCAVCIMHMKTRSMCFLVWPQNQGRRVFRFGSQNR
jgi:hypothetical protein